MEDTFLIKDAPFLEPFNWRSSPIQISRFYEHFKKFREICFAHVFGKFEYFAKVIIYIYSESPDHVF